MHLGKLKMLKSLILPDHLCCWKFFCVVFPFLTFESEALYFLKNVVPNGAPTDVAIFSVSKKQFTFAENLTWMDGSVGNFAPRELVSCDPGFYKEEKSRPCKPCPTGHRCLGGAGGSSGKLQAMLYPSCVLKNHGARMFWLLYYIIILRLPQTRQRIGRRRVPQRLSKRCFCQSDRQFQLH